MKRTILAMAAMLLAASPLAAQLSERPGNSQSGTPDTDLSGLSLKTPRVRVVHTEDLTLEGGSLWLQLMDPFLAFKMGKDLTQREFEIEHGVFVDGNFGEISNLKGTLEDGVTAAITGNDQVSCGGCHNLPYRDAGGGTNFSKHSGVGRNAPHFFGGGIFDMLAWQIRQKMMQQIDDNRDNWISLAEAANHAGQDLLVEPTPGATPISYGRPDDGDGDGRPDLNSIFLIWYVDSSGAVVDGAKSLNDPGVAGYNFALEVWGWGEKENNLNTTLRIFYWDPILAHTGLDAYDPTMIDDPEHDGWGAVSNAGIPQPWIEHIPPDLGNNLNSVGLSVDDPDGDGVISEITEGDLDMAEWYMLNAPRPGRGRITQFVRRGEEEFFKMGCAECHVMDWQIEPADDLNPDIHKRYLGDLRFFDLDVRFDPEDQRLEGRLIKLYSVDPSTGIHVRHRNGALIEGIGTDFRKHEMGPDFYQMHFDGTMLREFRTAPIWGNGASGFPWGHDGLSMTLDDVIRRHGGEAKAARDAYVSAPGTVQELVQAYLRSFLLYSTDQIPADIDGDGVISDSFIVAGKDTGYERFNPEWLFRVPGEIEGMVMNHWGEPIRSDQLVNIADAYGLNLAGLVDTDGDTFPDVIDECPTTYGYKDGCNN